MLFNVPLVAMTLVAMALVGLTAAEYDWDLYSKYLKMSSSQFIEYFNKQNYTWKMGHNDIHIDSKHLACAHIDHESFKKLPLLLHDLEAQDLPTNFDAREKWPQCETIKEVYDQMDCGSCWIFGTATPASDRTCIHKNIHVRLSEADFECLTKPEERTICDGGDPLEAFQYWQESGVVTLDCKPYGDIKELKEIKCITECTNNSIKYNEDKHFGEKVYRISDDINQIKAELVNNGPIQAAFNVYSDFHAYQSGVYVHQSGRSLGGHSVRVIGYGNENGQDYWLATNSWGKSWGAMGGLFKIKAYQEGIDFESYLIAGLPKK